jgi:primosomal protein N''
MQDILSEKTKAKRIEGVAYVLEHLLCKYEALSSNPSTTIRKKEKEKHYSIYRKKEIQ